MSLGRDTMWLRRLVGIVMLGALVWHVGAASVVDALRGVDGWSVAVAAALAAVTTACGAWRWVLVTRGLGLELNLRSAVAESYRSQFLNLTLPGGVVGDVRRGLRHGREAGQLGRGVRSVVWERAAGQAVLAALTVGALVALPSPWAPSSANSGRATVAVGPLAVLAVLAGLVVLVVLVVRAKPATAPPVAHLPLDARAGTRVARFARAAVDDARAGLLGRRTWPGVTAASVVVVGGHVASFLVAARAAGVTAPLPTLVPLALVVLVGMAVPVSIAGWGPREGVAAWAFGAAGLGASAGLGTAVVYGVLTLLSTLPGAVLMLVDERPAVPGPSPSNPTPEGAVRA